MVSEEYIQDEEDLDLEYYDLSGVSSRTTGLPYPIYFAVGKEPKGYKVYLKQNGIIIPVDLEFEGIDKILRNFIINNKQVIIAYWNYEISTKELIDGLIKSTAL